MLQLQHLWDVLLVRCVTHCTLHRQLGIRAEVAASIVGLRMGLFSHLQDLLVYVTADRKSVV